MTEPRELFTTPQAATFMCFEPSTLAAWRCGGEGPVYLKIGRSIRYRRADLEEWLFGGPEARGRIEENAECHRSKRGKSKRLRGRSAVEQRARRLALEPYCCDCRDRGICQLANEIDHIVPLDDGGSDEDENVRSLCTPCHAVRTRERLDEKAKTLPPIPVPHWRNP